MGSKDFDAEEFVRIHYPQTYAVLHGRNRKGTVKLFRYHKETVVATEVAESDVESLLLAHRNYLAASGVDKGTFGAIRLNGTNMTQQFAISDIERIEVIY